MKFHFTDEVKETIARAIAHEYYFNPIGTLTMVVAKSTVRLMLKSANIELNDANVDATVGRLNELIDVEE